MLISLQRWPSRRPFLYLSGPLNDRKLNVSQSSMILICVSGILDKNSSWQLLAININKYNQGVLIIFAVGMSVVVWYTGWFYDLLLQVMACFDNNLLVLSISFTQVYWHEYDAVQAIQYGAPYCVVFLCKTELFYIGIVLGHSHQVKSRWIVVIWLQHELRTSLCIWCRWS